MSIVITKDTTDLGDERDQNNDLSFSIPEADPRNFSRFAGGGSNSV